MNIVRESRLKDCFDKNNWGAVDINDLSQDLVGVYVVLVDGVKIPCFFSPNHNHDQMYVFLNGNRPHTNRVPFSRWSWYSFIDGIVINISDPMYLHFPNLNLGWYLGTEEKDFIETTSKLIKKIADVYCVPYENITLYGNSGGGTAAILISQHFKNISVISINAQLNLLSDSNRHRTEIFSEKTGIDLEYWVNSELNIDQFDIIRSSNNFYTIIENDVGEDGIQLSELANYFRINFSKGLTKYKNMVVWQYSANNNANPHKAIEDKHYFSLIIDLSKLLKTNCIDEHTYKEYYNYTKLWESRYESVEKSKIDCVKYLLKQSDVYHNSAFKLLNKYNGTGESYQLLAKMYYEGIGTAPDKRKAIEYLEKAVTYDGSAINELFTYLFKEYCDEYHDRIVQIYTNNILSYDVIKDAIDSYLDDKVKIDCSLLIDLCKKQIFCMEGEIYSKYLRLLLKRGEKKDIEELMNIVDCRSLTSGTLYHLGLFFLKSKRQECVKKGVFFLHESYNKGYWRAETELFKFLLLEGSEKSCIKLEKMCLNASDKNRGLSYFCLGVMYGEGLSSLMHRFDNKVFTGCLPRELRRVPSGLW